MTHVPSSGMSSGMSSDAERFLAALSEADRTEVARVRDVVVAHLPAGYEEAVVRGALVFQVPLARYPDTYNGHALWYVALAAQKRYLALHLMPVYGSAVLAARLREGFAAAGKRLDMGKACVRFRKADDLALDAVADIVASVPLDDWIAMARAVRRR